MLTNHGVRTTPEHCLSRSLKKNRMLRFPTLFAYLDTLITTYLEPRYGRHIWLEACLLVGMSSLIWSPLKREDRTGMGMISDAAEQVLRGVKKENQLFLRRKIVFCFEESLLE